MKTYLEYLQENPNDWNVIVLNSYESRTRMGQGMVIQGCLMYYAGQGLEDKEVFRRALREYPVEPFRTRWIYWWLKDRGILAKARL